MNSVLQILGEAAKSSHDVMYSTTLDRRVDPDDLHALGCMPTTVAAIFNDMMCAERPDIGLELLNWTGLLEVLMPSVKPIVGFGGLAQGHKDLWDHTKVVVRQTPARRVIRIAALYHDVGKPRAFRRTGGEVSFHGHEALSARGWTRDSRDSVIFPNKEENNIILMLIQGLEHVEAYDKDWSDSAVRRVYRDFELVWPGLIDLALSDVTTGNPERRQRAQGRTRHLDQRARSLKFEDDKAAAQKLPKGLGNIIAQVWNLEGRALGNYMHYMQELVSNGQLCVNPRAEDYIDWIKEHPLTVTR